MSDKFQALSQLGAGDFEHLDGSLIEHLNGTKNLLQQWGATIELQDAGLYHAAYGTAGFSQSLVSSNQRDKIASIIGADAEEIVYQYCACDRNDFFSRICKEEESSLEFLNRFTNESYKLPTKLLRYFCELTVANEIEIAIENPIFVKEHGSGLCSLFSNMAPYLSPFAQKKSMQVFGACNV